jgi:hypothetical protein
VDGFADEVPEIRQDEIDAEMLVSGEREPGVDHDPVVADLEHGHVLPDLAEAAERNDPERGHGPSLWTGIDGEDSNDGLGRDGREEPEPLEAIADPRRLRLVGLDEWQPKAADLVTEQLERALDRNRIRLHLEELDRGA